MLGTAEKDADKWRSYVESLRSSHFLQKGYEPGEGSKKVKTEPDKTGNTYDVIPDQYYIVNKQGAYAQATFNDEGKVSSIKKQMIAAGYHINDMLAEAYPEGRPDVKKLYKV